MTKFLNISTDTTLGGNSPSNETVSSQKAVKSYVDNFSRFLTSAQETTLLNGGTYLNTTVDNNSVFLKEDGTINVFTKTIVSSPYTIVGNPTISNDILSGLSDGSFLRINGTTPSSITSMDLLIRARLTGTDPSTLISNPDGNDLYFLVRSNHFGYATDSTHLGSKTLSLNTWYWFRVVGNSTTLTGYVIADDGYTQDTLPDLIYWSQEFTVDIGSRWNNTTLTFGWTEDASFWYWRGSIDLKNTVLKLNGSTWWSPTDIQYTYTLTPITYNKSQVGNATLTITQGGTTKGTFTANATTDVTIPLDAGSSVSIDNKSITENSSSQLQTVGVINQNATITAIKTWTGTKAQYNAITTKDTNTLYNITDDISPLTSVLETIYPVGSIYIGTMSNCPLAALFGTWTLKSSGMVLQGADSNHSAGTTIAAGLPNITGNIATGNSYGFDAFSEYTGAFAADTTAHLNWQSSTLQQDIQGKYAKVGFDASRSNSIYGNSTTVQPPAYVVNIWERTA